MFREWINAAATGLSFYTGMNAWHELPTRRAAVIRDAQLKAQAKAQQTGQREFAEAFKAAAD